MNCKKEYEQKLTSAEDAAKLIKDDDWVDFGWGIGLPYDLDKAVAEHITASDIRRINHALGVLERVAILVLSAAPRQRRNVLVEFIYLILKVVYVYSACIDLDLFAQLVGSPIFTIVEKIYGS